MKKYLFITLMVILFMTTGCVKNQIVCSGTSEEEGIKLTGTVTADLDSNDRVSDAVIVYEFENEENAKKYCSVFKVFEEEDKEGVIKVSCSGNKITMKGFSKLISEYDDTLIGASKEDFIKAMEENEYTCKKLDN